MELDRLIIMGDVSDLAGSSEEFTNFLTVSQKYGLTCVYIFHPLYPTRQHWQMILLQTKLFNFSIDQFMPLPLLEFHLPSVTDTNTTTYHIKTFGLSDCNMTSQT